MGFFKDLFKAWSKVREERDEFVYTKEQLELHDQMREAKEAATRANEPWVGLLSVDVNPENVSEGSFEFDWNDIFIAKLVRSGYRGKTQQDLVDQWFQAVCQNVIADTYGAYMADPENRKVEQEKVANKRKKTTKKDE